MIARIVEIRSAASIDRASTSTAICGKLKPCVDWIAWSLPSRSASSLGRTSAGSPCCWRPSRRASIRRAGRGTIAFPTGTSTGSFATRFKDACAPGAEAPAWAGGSIPWKALYLTDIFLRWIWRLSGVCAIMCTECAQCAQLWINNGGLCDEEI